MSSTHIANMDAAVRRAASRRVALQNERPGCETTESPAMSHGAVQRIEVADGTRLHALVWEPAETPTRPPFLLVHGLASNALLWTGVAARLAAAGHRVAAVDQRSHGRSDASDALDWVTLAEDLVGVADAMDLKRPIVVGQSWGGNVVLELGLQHPQAVTGIACLDGGWIELGARFAAWQSCWDALQPPRILGTSYAAIAAAMAQRHAGWPPDATTAQLGNLAVRPDGTAVAILTRERHRAIVRQLWEHQPSARWAELRVPALLLPVLGAGDAATRAAVATAERLAPRVRVHGFPDRHHDVHAQAPEEVAAALLDALDSGFFDGSPHLTGKART
jgi:pimeloyl-ACP methyl ester carboxylesterase